jgi:serine/threonine protein kinase
MILSHHNHASPYTSQALQLGQTPPTPTLLSAFSPNTLLLADRLRLIASMFSQMCEAVAVCHETGISHRDIKPENFICCDSVELETVAEHQARTSNENDGQIRLQTKRKVIVKLTDFGLATTDYENQDMMCGSKPYMSYGKFTCLGRERCLQPECRNGHVGPSYRPAPADVWSLGVVLLNMIFHRACWSDAADENPKFAQYLRDRKRYLINQFPGIGNQVATFLADHVLCLDVGDRVSARDFGRWVRNLPEMIAGKAAVKDMKHTVKAIRAKEEDRGLFAKSPIVRHGSRKAKTSTSALTTTAPTAMGSYQGLSSLPPPSHMAKVEPELGPETATMEPTPVQPTLAEPIDTSPDHDASPTEAEADAEAQDAEANDDAGDDASRSIQKKKKRGARRKGKATQAALAAEKTEPEREALLAELADASQSLARDLSKTHIPRVDTQSPEQFPPLGTSDAQIAESKAAQANRSKWWREKLSFSSTSHNPQLLAFAQRVADREQGGHDVKGGFGNWSAPAKMQDDHRVQLAGRPTIKHTTTMSTSGVTSQLSSFGGFGAVSSATSSGIEEEPEESKLDLAAEEENARAQEEEARKAKEAEDARAAKAVQAATLLSSNLGSMGSFGQRPQHVPRHGPLHGKNMAKSSTPAPVPITQPKVETKSKPAAVVVSPASGQTVKSYNLPTTPSTASTLKSPATATDTRSTTSTVPSLVQGSSSGSSAAPTAPSSSSVRTAPAPVPIERPGKFKERVQVLGNILRGVNLSNKKE